MVQLIKCLWSRFKSNELVVYYSIEVRTWYVEGIFRRYAASVI